MTTFLIADMAAWESGSAEWKDAVVGKRVVESLKRLNGYLQLLLNIMSSLYAIECPYPP
jgi:hypothetical protein